MAERYLATALRTFEIGSHGRCNRYLLNALKLTEKLSDKTIDLDRRLVKLETLVEVAKCPSQPPKLGQE